MPVIIIIHIIIHIILLVVVVLIIHGVLFPSQKCPSLGDKLFGYSMMNPIS